MNDSEDDEVGNAQESDAKLNDDGLEGDSNADEMNNAELGHGVAGGSDGDPSADEMDLADDTANTPTAGSSLVSYKTISLGADFENFFTPARNEILVRDEYVAMLDHIKTVQKKKGPRGIVVVGQPGIGKDLPQCPTSDLDVLDTRRKNTISILRTH
jgi:hypothetical protein